MQGSGTFGNEAVIGSAVPSDGRLLVAANGAYGRRLADMAERLGVDNQRLESPEHLPVDVEAFKSALADAKGKQSCPGRLNYLQLPRQAAISSNVFVA